MNIITGKAWKFGDDINTDVIAPGRYMSTSLEEMRHHVLETVNPRFAREVCSGDIIIAGNNFGCGSSREEAPTVLQACGIDCIIAESFARIFYRNSLAVGLPVIICKGVSTAFSEGEPIQIDFENSIVTGLARNNPMNCEPLSNDIKRLLEKGGILPLLREIAAGQNDE